MVDLHDIFIRGSVRSKDEYGQRILEITDPHALIQAAGYLKYRCSQIGENVYCRGQTTTYQDFSPSLFRGISKSQSTQSARAAAKNRFVEKVVKKCWIFDRFSKIAHEPLLQHYGLQTTWIDIVDNIWIALWFAVHRSHATGKERQFLHFERRNPFDEQAGRAFIIFVGCDAQLTPVPGFWKGKNTETVDLRACAPSIFLRPHAQHGLLFRMRGQGVLRPVSYSTQIRGVISVSLSDALRWLGEAPTLSAHGLFPPPYYDYGYKILLEGGFGSDSKVGSIISVGA